MKLLKLTIILLYTITLYLLNAKSSQAASLDSSVLEIDDENENIEVLLQNKNAGRKRVTPSEPVSASPVTAKNHPEKCTWCHYKSIDPVRLKTHIKEKHQQCDVCDISFKTPVSLREHMKNRHGSQNGTAVSCEDCNFSALSKVHLRKHQNKHNNKERKCGQCQYKTNNEYKLESHITQQHKQKRQVTCRYWKAGNCNKQNCSFLHEIVMCRYGSRCYRRNSCRYGHPDETVREGQNISPWIYPAFSANSSCKNEFPFLGQRPMGQCHNQCCIVRGRGF